jgi:hypothetical protein
MSKFEGELKVDKFNQSLDREDKPKEKTYLVMLNKNFTKEFKIGRRWLRFEPYGRETLTQSEINHPDFKQQEEYFSIKEN